MLAFFPLDVLVRVLASRGPSYEEVRLQWNVAKYATLVSRRALALGS